MKSSTKMASLILLIIAICLYTISGIQPEFKKSKVYDDPEILITEYITCLKELNDINYSDYGYSYDNRVKVLRAKISKVCETMSKRNRALAYDDEAEYLDANKIAPGSLNNILNEFLIGSSNSDYNNINIMDINKVEKQDYTQRLESFMDEYNESYNKISKYERPKNVEVYKVNAENNGKKKNYENNESYEYFTTYIIYFIVVDEGEGLVIDSARVFNTTEG